MLSRLRDVSSDTFSPQPDSHCALLLAWDDVKLHVESFTM